jgi:RNA polymerase-binding transcription factor
MEATKISELRQTLERRRTEIQGEIDRMAVEVRSLGVDQDDEKGSLGNHLADDGSNVMEAERLSTISGDIQDILVQINAALERMDDGTYGLCLRCGKPINPERLEAFPYVAYDIECQSILEREHALRSGR